MKAYCTQFSDRECRERDCCLSFSISEDDLHLYYKLDENKNATPCTREKWAEQYEEMFKTDTKHVKKEMVGDYFVSTVWLGMNHAYISKIPLIFETMISKDKEWLDYQVRYSTWKEAEEGHKKAVQWVVDGCKEDEEN